jgi:tRNA/rRNA methyltransferase
MAGTDRTQSPVLGGPTIILVEPQLGENIGTAARAMLNFGLTSLRLVNPRDGWPSDKALSAASGADVVIEGAVLFETTAAAIADLNRVYATSARRRDMLKTVITPERVAEVMHVEIAAGSKVGILFGPERTGLTNDDVTLADALISVPLNPAYASLNIAQAVLLIGYEWFQRTSEMPAEALDEGHTYPAPREELLRFFEHLESELDASGFLRPPEKRPAMVRNVRNMFQRAGLMEQEVRILRGIVTALARHRRPDQ